MVHFEPADIEPAERESDCLLAAGSSSNGAREAREWIERRGGPTFDSLQLRACIRARPMECRDRETSNRHVGGSTIADNRAKNHHQRPWEYSSGVSGTAGSVPAPRSQGRKKAPVSETAAAEEPAIQ